MSKTLKNIEGGYIAVTSAIVISFLLLAITVSLGLNGFFGRFNVVDSESKERSSALAEACVETALLDAAENTYHASPQLVTVANPDNCTIISSVENSPEAGKTSITTQACINKSVTNLKVIINNSDFSIFSWEELPTLTPC